MRFYEFKNYISKGLLTEGARIQHAEDIIFWEGTAGAVRALESLRNLEKGGHKDVTIKWDGSPAVIFGRDEEGNFIFTDKSGFGAKGYDGKPKTAQALQQMLLARPGANNPDPEKANGYRQFASNMTDVFDEFEKALSKDFRGFLKGDMLYFNTPDKQSNRYVFKPNIVTYSVDANSDIGRKIGQSKAGIVIHRLVDETGAERPLAGNEVETIIQGIEVLVLPPVVVQEPPNVDETQLQELKSLVSKNARAVDALLNQEFLKQQKVSDLSNIFYTYLNSKVDTGLDNLAGDFTRWLQGAKLSDQKKAKILEIIGNNSAGFNAMWSIVAGIMRVKDDIINQLENQKADIESSINGEKGGEGYVLAHPEGDIKLVPREFFTRANRAVER